LASRIGSKIMDGGLILWAVFTAWELLLILSIGLLMVRGFVDGLIF
jgi:hypothetical protein